MGTAIQVTSAALVVNTRWWSGKSCPVLEVSGHRMIRGIKNSSKEMIGRLDCSAGRAIGGGVDGRMDTVWAVVTRESRRLCFFSSGLSRFSVLDKSGCAERRELVAVMCRCVLGRSDCLELIGLCEELQAKACLDGELSSGPMCCPISPGGRIGRCPDQLDGGCRRTFEENPECEGRNRATGVISNGCFRIRDDNWTTWPVCKG